jgi:hypothetical protein
MGATKTKKCHKNELVISTYTQEHIKPQAQKLQNAHDVKFCQEEASSPRYLCCLRSN